MREIDEHLLGILVCPESHAPLVQAGEWLYSTDRNTRRKYAIRDGLPILLLDESEVVGVEEFERIMTLADKRRAQQTENESN